MKQISYQGQSRSEGFRPIQAGYAGLDKMRERDNQVIGDLKEERDRQDQIVKGNISELEAKFSREEQNRQELKRLEDKTYEVRSAALAQNEEVSRRNAEAEIQTAANQGKAWAALGKMSQTLGKQLTEYQGKKNEQDMMDGYNEALMNGLPTDQIIGQAKGELELFRQGQGQEAIADAFMKRGADPQVVNRMRSGNKWRDYGRLKAYSEMAGQQYGGWLQQQLNQLGSKAAKPEDRAAAIAQLQQQYLKQNGLFGLSAGFLGPMFSKMRQASNASMASARAEDVYNTSQGFLDDAHSALFVQRTPQALNELFHSAATAYDKQGRIAGNSAGVEAVFGALKDTNRYASDTEVMELLENTITDTGESFAQRYPGRVIDLQLQRRKGAREIRGLRDSERKEKGRVWQEESLAYLNGLEEIPAKALDDLIKFGKEEKFDVSRLEALQYKTAESKNIEFYASMFEEKFKAGTLTLEEINANDVPPKVRNSYLDKVNKLQAARNSAPEGADEVKSYFTNKLRNRLNPNNTERGTHESLGPAISAAVSLYQRDFAARIANGATDINKAHEAAMKNTVAQVDDPDGRWAKLDASEVNGNFASFPGFTYSGETSLIPQQVKNFSLDPTLINKQLLVPSTRLESIGEAINNGQIPSVPPVYMELAKNLKIDPRAILNAQLELAGVDISNRQPSAAETLREVTEDPRYQELLQKPTYQNVSTAILGSTASGGYSSPDSRGKALIAMASRHGWDPADLAAIFSFETGGTLDPSEPGRGAAEGRIGLIQAGPNERASYGLGSGNWHTEMEAVAKYLTDRGAKPGMGLEDLYATVNGGNPGAGYTPDGNGTVARSQQTMAQLMVHRAQASERLGLKQSSIPQTRNPDNMSPTMTHFYTTGGATNGGWSEHTDIKQADNPNTVVDEWGAYWEPDELDSYISFTDPKFGKITLSDLRKRIPIPGGNFGDPRPYGPHAGWDYPTKAGTKLYLTNGARIVSRKPVPGNGTRTTIRLPDGRYFAFLHGD